jgi:histidyl-tRNA synthetase
MKEQKIEVKKPRGVEICIVQLGDKAKEDTKEIYDALTKNDINVYFVPTNDSLRQQIKTAVKLDAKYAVIIGQQEAVKDEIILRDLDASSQEVFPAKDLIEELKKRMLSCPCEVEPETKEE